MEPYELPLPKKQQLSMALPKFKGDPDGFVAETCKAVARITGCTAMITTPVDTDATLKRLELLQMSRNSVLIAILTSSGMMKSKLCQLDSEITDEEIGRFTQILNERFADIKLSQITPALAQTLAVSFGIHTLKYAPLLEQVFEAAQDAVRTSMRLEGQANLLLYKEFSPASVIELFARRESLLSILQKAKGTTVFLGNEMGDEALTNAGMIVCGYRLNGCLQGKIAILAPMKIDYYRMIPTLEYIAKSTENHLKTLI
jgi:heat-inducible transcriptional repressor